MVKIAWHSARVQHVRQAQHASPGSRWTRIRAVAPKATATMLVLAVLAGCSVGDDGDHQFATDQKPAGPTPTATPVTPPPALGSPAPVVTPRPLASLIAPRGAPRNLYFNIGDDVWLFSPDTPKPRRIFSPPAGFSLIGISQSPTADRVAVLSGAAHEPSQITILNSDGAVLATRVLAGGRGATPLAGGAPPMIGTGIDWSPQGERVLVSTTGGELLAWPVSLAGDPELLVRPDEHLMPFYGEWSPTGAQIAFVSPLTPGGPTALLIAPATGTPAPPSGVTPREGLAIRQFRWMPDGRSILFTESDRSTLHSTNTDLWMFSSEKGRTLVAAAGSAAPVADIALFSPSPDGAVVAYTVNAAAGQSNETFHSLWLKELATGKTYQVATPDGIDVVNIWWTDEGLVYRAIPANARDASEFTLYLVTPDGKSKPLLVATNATPVASPGAIVATPEPAA